CLLDPPRWYFTKCCQGPWHLYGSKMPEIKFCIERISVYCYDSAFYEKCKMEYLKEREEFRKTGIPTKRRLWKLPTSISQIFK
uniref:Uncharacterized protein n=1 Tax=Sciurus vulgaris TaxID=55149 RepID=A0A8D2D6Y3_SCIVU